MERCEVEVGIQGWSLGDVGALRWCLEVRACRGRNDLTTVYRFETSASNVRRQKQNSEVLTQSFYLLASQFQIRMRSFATLLLDLHRAAPSHLCVQCDYLGITKLPPITRGQDGLNNPCAVSIDQFLPVMSQASIFLTKSRCHGLNLAASLSHSFLSCMAEAQESLPPDLHTIPS